MISENIKKIRTERNMTQKELADKLHVTAQAVSRWETGEVDVSIDTVQEMSKIFGVTINELIEGKKEEKEIVVEKEYVVQESRPVLAVCEKCNKPIFDGSDIVRIKHSHRGGSSTEIRCKACNEKIKKAELDKDIQYGKSQRIKSFVWGGIITGILLLIAIWSTASSDSDAGTIVGAIIGALVFFPFLSCLFLKNNFVMDMFGSVVSWGFVRMPGVIFSLDLDGIIWLLTVKLLFFILGLMLSVMCFLFALALGLTVSIFVYPFALSKSIKHPELSKNF